MRVGFSASTRGNNEVAAAAWSRASGSGHAEAAPLAAVNLGGLRWRLGDTDGALAAFEQASTSRHAHAAPWASVRLGLLRKQLGDAEGAAAAFEQAGASGHPDAAPLAALNLRLLRNQGNGQAGAPPGSVQLTHLRDPGYARRAYQSVCRVGASSGGAGGRQRAGVPRGGAVTCGVGGNGAWRDELMGLSAEAGREFWRGVLVAGGFTAIPRWTLEPATGVAEHEATVRDDLAAALRRLADELAVPLSSVLLAAHAKVLAALSGEREVVTGYVAVEGGRPLPCRLTTEPGSWRARAAGHPPGRVGAAVAQGLPGRRSPARAGPDRAVVRDRLRPGRRRRRAGRGHVLWVGTSGHGGRLRAAAALPDRRARRRLRRQDRRLPPHRARADRRRSGCRAPAPEPALGRGAPAPARRARRTPPGAARPPGSTSCSSSGSRPTRTPSRPCTPAGGGPTGSSTPGPTGWDGPCWRGGWAAKVSSRW